MCIICGRRPRSFYAQVDFEKRDCIFCTMFNVDVDRLFEDHPGAVGVVCLSCLLTYKRREKGELK